MLRTWMFSSAILCILAFISGCRGQTPRHGSVASSAYTAGKIQAVLFCNQTSWEPSQPLVMTFALVNGTSSPVRLDSRAARASQLHVMVRLTDSRVILADKLLVDLVPPRASDIIVLKPGRLYGTVITIDRGDKLLSDELRKPRPGCYSFWVEYYGPSSEDLRLSGLTLASNECQVVVTCPRS